MISPGPAVRLDWPGKAIEPLIGDARLELVLVWNEHLEAVAAQRVGALVDERALVGREERTGEVDVQDTDATATSAPSEVAVRAGTRSGSQRCTR